VIPFQGGSAGADGSVRMFRWPCLTCDEAVRLSGVVGEGPLRTPAYLRGRGVNFWGGGGGPSGGPPAALAGVLVAARVGVVLVGRRSRNSRHCCVHSKVRQNDNGTCVRQQLMTLETRPTAEISNNGFRFVPWCLVACNPATPALEVRGGWVLDAHSLCIPRRLRG
jgi:hypothetical protein